MAVFFGYTDVILGSQSTVNGSAFNYNFAPTVGADWQWTGTDTYIVIKENDGASNFNGDPTNEQVSAQEQIGGTWEQVVEIGGTDRQVIWDYTFTVTDGTDTWHVGVIDVDLNNDDDLGDAGEDGYYLVFPDGLPPVGTDLTVGAITENDSFTPHSGLGGSVVCFVTGTPVDTPDGPCPVEDLRPGDLVETRDGGTRPVLWSGVTHAVARDDLAPIRIAPGAFGSMAEIRVSPQHSIPLRGWNVQMLFGEEEVLVRAKDLVGLNGVSRAPGGVVGYHHILLDSHQLVGTCGLWSESLYPGDIAMAAFDDDAQDALAALVPDPRFYGPRLARCLRSQEARLLRRALSAQAHTAPPGEINKKLPGHPA